MGLAPDEFPNEGIKNAEDEDDLNLVEPVLLPAPSDTLFSVDLNCGDEDDLF